MTSHEQSYLSTPTTLPGALMDPHDDPTAGTSTSHLGMAVSPSASEWTTTTT
jgi:hypothetical protein